MNDERSETTPAPALWPPLNWVYFESTGPRVHEQAVALWHASGTAPRVYSARGSTSPRFRDQLFGRPR